ncbi:MAG: hypothetical protein M0P72_12435 [Metallibacterium scheffleri]|jgi:ribonuclease I|uniref:ribonuclease T2 family protein n=1 Tax=Metallibacterium scheffleri TaxID=993689 RepID=UPI0026EB8098|nr:hypothetical protein [Metallibacterium scheffleri]MCK9367938.1 hypothetical protein [Metallibacterium scheffleri]
MRLPSQFRVLMLAALLTGLPLFGAVPARADDSAAAHAFNPAPNGKPGLRFGHYTFALLWAPGACLAHDELAGPDCATRTPGAVRSRQWSLHGLWASTPVELKAQRMPDPTWWRYGCYWYRPDHAIPQRSCSNAPLQLPPALHARLWTAMPAATTCLDRHEYFKHAQCLGFRPAPFFTQALHLLAAVNANAFTAWMRAQRGRTIRRAALLTAFQHGFKLTSSAALELRCGRGPGARREDVLVQAWLTIRSDRLAQFPAPASFMAGRRGNCPARIFIAR